MFPCWPEVCWRLRSPSLPSPAGAGKCTPQTPRVGEAWSRRPTRLGCTWGKPLSPGGGSLHKTARCSKRLESVSGRQCTNPQLCPRPNPQSLWMLPHSKREFADVIQLRISRRKDYPGLFSWECNHNTDYKIDMGEVRGKGHVMMKQRLEWCALKVEEGAEAGGQDKLEKVKMWIFFSELTSNQPW